MGDDRRQVQAALDEYRHLVPGLVHLPAVDTADGQHVEDDFFPVNRVVGRRNTEHGDFAAVADVVEDVLEGRWGAGHLQCHVEALGHVQFFLHVVQRFLADVDAAVRTEVFGQPQPVVADVGDDHVPRASVFADGRRDATNRAGAGDQHVLAQQVELQRGVHGVAVGVENRGDVQVDARAVYPDVGHRQGNVLGEGARPIHADARRVGAEVASARHAVAAAPADHVALAGNDLPGVEVVDVVAHLDDFADEFVADHHRHRYCLRRPLVPLVDMQVGAADRCFLYLDQNVVEAGFRLRDVFHPDALAGFALDQCFHIRAH